MSRNVILRATTFVGLVTILTAPVVAENSGDALEQGFADPPDSAKPRVWWHWMNGNITKEGIKLDLEWMKRVGIGGFQNFDAALNTRAVSRDILHFWARVVGSWRSIVSQRRRPHSAGRC